jgi:ribosomal protein RSM22 (predicted rRNA methylase)
VIAPDSELLVRMRHLWERALPALTGEALPPSWGTTLRALSDRFNRIEGAPRGDYFAADNLDAFFAHHGWAQAHALAALAAERPAAFEGKQNVWDLGGGPGVLSLAASALLPEARFLLADLRPEALQWAESHLKGIDLRTQKLRLPALPEGAPDLVLLGHVLNELPERDQDALLEALKARLAPGGVIVMLEPALPTQTRRLMQLREAFLEAPWSIQAPCPCPGPCPMLALKGQWCVAELDWDPPRWFVELDTAAGLDRRHLTFAYLITQRDVGALAPIARIVGVPKKQKGKTQRWMCTPEGGEIWEALDRHGEPVWAQARGAELEPAPADQALRPQGGAWPIRRWKA